MQLYYPVDEEWRDVNSPDFSCLPKLYRIKPEFTPPEKLFFVEYDWMMQSTLSHTAHRTIEDASAWLDSVEAKNGRTVCFVLDNDYVDPGEPREVWINIYKPKLFDTDYGGVRNSRKECLNNTAMSHGVRAAKFREVQPRIMYLHHDPGTGKEIVTRCNLGEDDAIVNKYVESL